MNYIIFRQDGQKQNLTLVVILVASLVYSCVLLLHCTELSEKGSLISERINSSKQNLHLEGEQRA